MSVVVMKKITLIAPLENMNDILKTIQREKLLHLIPRENKMFKMSSVIENNRKKLENSRTLLSLTTKALAIISQGKSLNAKKTASRRYQPENFWEYLRNIDKLSNQKSELKSQLLVLQRQIDEYSVWGNFDLLDIVDIEDKTGFKLSLAKIDTEQTSELMRRNVHFHILNEVDGKYFVLIAQKDKHFKIGSIFFPKESLSILENTLSDIVDKIKGIDVEFQHLISLEENILEKHLDVLRHIEILDTKNYIYTSENLFGLQGFIPKSKYEYFEEKLLKNQQKIVLRSSSPNKSDNVPLLLKNFWLFKSFESILTLFSGLSYHEKDITPVISVLFITFGSLCFIDGGYGIALIIFGLILRQQKIMDFGTIAVSTGIVASIVGFLNGQIFGLVVGEHILKYSTPMFSLAVDPLFCLTFSLYVGATIMCLSYLTAIWQNGLKTEATGSFLCSCTVIIYIILDNIASVTAFKDQVVLFMIFLTLISWVMYHESPFGKPLWDIIWVIYSGPTGLLQDILSHMRLFGISLSGAILALVVNDIGMMLPIYIQLPFLAFGHFFVFCLSLLSLYVHSNRLIFLEFGSNCINGGHFYYLPLGRN